MGNSIVETTFGLVQLNGYYQRPKATDACRVRHLKSKTEISVSALLALHVVFFDQLSGAACTWKLVDIFFVFAVSSLLVDFRTFSVNFHLKTLKNVFKKLKKLFLDFSRKISVKRWKWIIKGWKLPKKVFWPALGCARHPKAGRNTQHFQSWVVGSFERSPKNNAIDPAVVA